MANTLGYLAEDTTGASVDILNFKYDTEFAIERTSKNPEDPDLDNTGGGAYSNPTLGNARIDENGNTTGGSAGDSTKREVCTQNMYYPDNGWTVFRATDPERAEKIALAMEAACKNNNIGYDQSNRNSLFDLLKEKNNYNPAKADKKVECDCSSLVRVCCWYAGIEVGDFVTSTESKVLTKSSKITKKHTGITESKKSKLQRGDILLKPGHTAVYLGGGYKNKVDVPKGKGYGTKGTFEFGMTSWKRGWYTTSSGKKITFGPNLKVWKAWKEDGCKTTNGYASLNGNILIACTSTFGSTGDKIVWEFSNGTTLSTIMTDTKNQNDSGCNKWGHDNGKSMVEFCGIADSETKAKQTGDPYYSFGLNGKRVVRAYNYGKVV